MCLQAKKSHLQIEDKPDSYTNLVKDEPADIPLKQDLMPQFDLAHQIERRKQKSTLDQKDAFLP